ncbi:NAD(P)-dependent oxidoreductase [Devosia sp. FKR38]|uniref:NAD-dependent epimerase/dehydratase family protein n=1 Tax=Devosia sp. FKR38 TaxID=2562312 RepID=UPI0010C100DC|nr:NAD(P)-dependent oxidoreductase [Devosia sp. FKR38]
MSNTAVVLGGSGFIGSHLLRLLAGNGRHGRIVSLDIAEPRERLDGVEYHLADLRDPIPDGFGNAGATLYNLVALRNFPGHPFQDYYETNVVSVQRAIDFAERIGALEMVFTSTMSVYGPGEDPKVESSPLRPVNPYGHSKRIGEALNAGWLARDPRRRLVTCRPAVIFGYRDDGNFTRLARLLERGMFVFVGRRDTIKSSGYVGDLVRSFLFALDSGQREVVYNFAYPKSYTIADVVDAFRAVANFAPARATVPLPLLNMAAIPFEVANAVGLRNPVHRDRIRKLYESTNIVPRWLVDHGFEFETDLRSALAEWQAQSPGGRFV